MLNQPKYLTPFSDGSIARLDEKGPLLVGSELISIQWTEPLVSKRIVEALNINPSVKVDGFSSVCMFVKTMTDDDKEYQGHSG